MTRPSLLTYLLSSPIILLGLWALTLWQGYAALQGEVSFLVPFILACFAGSSMRASEQVQKFHRWNREWNLMHGVMPLRIRFAALRRIAGAVLWAVAGYYLFRHGDDPGLTWAAAVFWAGTAILVLRGLYRAVRRGDRPQGHRVRDVAVTVCLSARRSGSLRQAYAALPDYCVPLFRRDTDAV